MHVKLTNILDLPAGAVIEWDGSLWKVQDVRKHAMTDIDNTAWLILEGWKDHEHRDPPKADIDTMVMAVTV